MKWTSIAFIIFLLQPKASAQDEVKHDPLLGRYILANSAELVHLTELNVGRPILRHDLHDFSSTGQMTVPGTGGANDSLGVSVDTCMDYVAADVNGDGKDELVIARAGNSNTLTISVSSAHEQSPGVWIWDPPAVLESSLDTVAGPIRVVALNMDWTPRQELVVYFRNPQGLKVNLYDSIDAITQQPIQLGSQFFPAVSFPVQEFDLATGDFDRDGLDEVIFLTHEKNPSNQHSLMLYLADYDPDEKSVTWWPGAAWDADGIPWGSRRRLKITAGDFRHVGHDEAVISATEIVSGSSGRQVYSYVTIDPVARTFHMDFPLLTALPVNWSVAAGYETNAISADLNPLREDGDELVVAGPSEVGILKFDGSLKPYFLSRKTIVPLDGNVEPRARMKFLAVADINADTAAAASWAPEIVLAQHAVSDGSTYFSVYEVSRNAADSITGLNQLFAGSGGSPASTISEIVMGDFNGDGIRVGPPALLTKQFVYQPIVELNVPPTHFDFLDGQVYDICKVNGPSPSEFSVTYTETQSQTSHFTSELSQTWGVSGEISGGFSLFGFKVNAYAKGSYDRGYYGSHSVSTTTTASQVTQSWGDDWILATVADYDFWEYPLYALGNHPGNLLVVIPHYRGTEWFPRRNVIARNWMADHEVGNLFSYVRKDGISGWTGANLLSKFTGKYISQASAGIWSLDLSTQTIDEDRLSSSIGAEVGVSVKRWGIEAKVSGSYSRDQITTHTSTATKDVLIEVKTSDTDKSFGDTDYLVTPYIYWAEDGALVIDYAVDPSTLGNPLYGTFWDKNYLANADPGFILPWRLDSLKGIGGTANMKLYSTSLHVSPMTPSAGDILHITARVHNFSLKNMDAPAIVRFYLGDPANGGTPIVGTGGLTDVSTDGPIAAQGVGEVEMDWVVPSGLSQTETLYGVIDPENTMVEIHDDNNVGFVPLSPAGPTGVQPQAVRPLPDRYVLEQNYPNPFNPMTVIPYELPRRSHVTLTVYDLLGHSLATVVNDDKEAGRFHAIFDARNLASGVYFYRLQAGDRVMTRKMLLVK
jgi:hypothetical protein